MHDKHYFTVKYQTGGHWYHCHVEALDGMDATRLVMNRNAYAPRAQVVREISLDEFKRLTA